MSANEEVEVEIVEEVFVDGQLAELVIIEEFAKRGEKPPHAKIYVIRIDKETYRIHTHNPTGEELLHLAGKTSAGYKLYQIFRGRQPEPVAPNQHVDLHAHGIERFTTVQKDPTEGASVAEALRRDFKLAVEDVEYLDSLRLPWETVKEPNGTLLLIIDGWSIPTGYNVPFAELALVIPPGYPDTQVDMAYFSPALSRRDGKQINNLTSVTWQPSTVYSKKAGCRHRPWAVCLPRNHILAQKPAINVADLHGAIVFWFPSSMHPGFFRRSVKYIHSLGVSPVFKEVHATIQAIEFVAHGFGLALLPRSAIRLARAGVVFKLLSDRYLKLETALFMRADQRAGTLQDFIYDLSFRLRKLGNEIQ